MREGTENIIQQDQAAFQAWAPNHQGEIVMPQASLRYLIPPRLYALPETQNPAGLDVRPYLSSGTDFLSYFVLEHRDENVSDPQAFLRFMAQLRNSGLRRPRKPESVDQMHVDYADIITSGALTLKDYVTNMITLEALPEGELYVHGYIDRAALREKGVLRSFWEERLRPGAKALGFRYITGAPESQRSHDYFTGRLGHKLLEDTPTQLQQIFIRNHGDDLGTGFGFTVDALYPEDLQTRS